MHKELKKFQVKNMKRLMTTSGFSSSGFFVDMQRKYLAQIEQNKLCDLSEYNIDEPT